MEKNLHGFFSIVACIVAADNILHNSVLENNDKRNYLHNFFSVQHQTIVESSGNAELSAEKTSENNGMTEIDTETERQQNGGGVE